MARVELVLTDSRVWAVGPATHWDVAPSVVLGSSGNLVVGESLTPPTQVSSAVQFIPAERIALLPRVPSVTDAMAAVVEDVLMNLGVAVPTGRITVVCPTEWGTRRRSVVADAVRRFTDEVAFEDTATRSVAADERGVRGRRTVVLEFGSTTTTATSVVPGPHGPHLESCELATDLAAADLIADPSAVRNLSALLDRVLDGATTDVVQVVGIADPATLEAIGSAVRQSGLPEAEIRPISGGDLVRGARPEPEYRPSATQALPANEWLQPLRERAAAQREPRRRGTNYILAAVAVVAVVAVAGVGVVVALGGSDDDTTTAAPPTTAVTLPATVGATNLTMPPRPSGTLPGPTPEVLGPISFQVPRGWKVAAATGDARADLSPVDGTRLRITLTRTSVAPGAGYEQIAADLEAQMKRKPTIGDLRRDVVFGGRSMLAYIERPEGGSTVRWHVLVEHGTQVSIGCQYPGVNWDALATTCDTFAAAVRVAP